MTKRDGKSVKHAEGNEGSPVETQDWTYVGYDWVALKIRSGNFKAGPDPAEAEELFRSMNTRDNLLALVPGTHTRADGLRTFKLSIRAECEETP